MKGISDAWDRLYENLKTKGDVLWAARVMCDIEDLVGIPLPIPLLWHDMRSAPKDGTRILVRFEHANYRLADAESRHRWVEVCIAHWIDHNGGGWTWHGICGEATYWRHLPEFVGHDHAGGSA